MAELRTAGPTLSPSGAQIELRHGEQRAWIVEQSGGLRQYTVSGVDLLDGYGADARCTDARGQVLVPWPNRLRDGAYDFNGADHQLPLSEPEKRNAIHGLVRWDAWRVGDRSNSEVVMEHDLLAQDGYPFTLQVSVRYRLADEGLSVRISATNAGSEVAPFGAGMHPYFSLGADLVDELELRAPGQRWLRLDDCGIPTGTADVAGTDYDFREPRPIGATQLDTAFTDLLRERDGRARIELRSRVAAVSIWLDEAFRHLMLFTGDTLPETGRRRKGLGVEPMTCPPNAFATGTDVIELEPGRSVRASWGIDLLQ
jgi:galactose mutarotase-like enzyme